MSNTRASTALDELTAQLPDELVVVDIGCRWGFAPHWEPLGSKVKLVGFDADDVEVTRLRAEFEGRENMSFHARVLGSHSGHATFIHRAEEAQSSLLDTAWSRLAHLPEYETSRVVRESRVELSTLDDWMTDFGVARVDALKLDTQGSELDILRGASTCLTNVRHVEVEVMFNPLFEAGPLFGEVDAFLRDRGFVLWRFRDVVSHALRDVPDPPPANEVLWYEGTPQQIRVPGGQHMWCNAHFVREEMYAPGRLAWSTRLRDLCLMHALEFHDLALLSLTRMVTDPDCPEATRSAAAKILDERAGTAASPQTPPSEPRRVALARRARTLRDRARRL